ncbi:MAG: hypothetical protein WA726_09930, partial [Acidimicrobiia bacterium]
RGGSEDAAVGSTTPTTPSAITTEPGTQETGTGIPPIDGCTLLTETEVDEALGGVGVAGDHTTYVFDMLSGNETCLWKPRLNNELVEGLSAGVGPGDPSDFADNAELEGISGSPVTGVGDLAVWFATDTGGTISVAETTPLGYLFLRVGVQRANEDDATRLQAAKDLAAEAIRRAVYGPDPEPAKVNLCELVTDSEAEEVLGPYRDAHPATLDEVMSIGSETPVDLSKSGDAVCTKLILAEIYVRTEQGSPDDFSPGATMEGVAAQPVSAVGDDAVWFGGVFATRAFEGPHENGVLSIHQDDYYFRIELALPDVDPADELEIAIDLAARALVRINALARTGAGDATIITVDHHPPAAPDHVDLVDNLLAREDAGEWTRGEGLAQTLQMLLGEIDADQVIPQGDILNDEATGIVNLARLYLVEDPDSAVAEQVRRLLGMLIFSDTQLEEMAGVGAPTASLGWVGLAGVTAAAGQNCQAFFTGWAIPIGIGQCLEKRTSFLLEDFFPGEYKVFGPAPPLPTGGWQDRHYDLAIEAMEEIVFPYKELGQLPPVNIVFSVLRDAEAGAAAAPHLKATPESQNRPCGVVLFKNIQNDSDLDFKQFIAHEMAHCLHGDTFPNQYVPPTQEWWDEGLADYLSNTINDAYAKNDLEHDSLPDYESTELSKGILDHKYGNFFLFQQLSWSYGNRGIFDIISSLPAGGDRAAQEAALGHYPSMPDRYHEFIEKVTDINVEDTSKGIIPNVPDSESLTLGGPTLILDDPLPFGVTRLALSVPAGQYACMKHDQKGDVLTSWRPGRPGAPEGSWSRDMPEVLTGEAVVVTTATGPGAEMSIYVEKVSEEPDCEATTTTVCPFCLSTSNYFKVIEQLSNALRDALTD